MPSRQLAVLLNRTVNAEQAVEVGDWVFGWMKDDDDESSHRISHDGKQLLITTDAPVTQEAIDAFLKEVNCYVEGDLDEQDPRVLDVLLA